jgi:hypothetical protein
MGELKKHLCKCRKSRPKLKRMYGLLTSKPYEFKLSWKTLDDTYIYAELT